MLSALDVAWFFVRKGEGNPSVTQLKLQKLVYYAQGFHLAIFGEPLFSEEIAAWEYGPVVVKLRQLHRDRGADTILPAETAFGSAISNNDTVAFLDKVWSRFGSYKAGELVDMTHSEPPWYDSYHNRELKISPESMQNHFSHRISELDTKASEIPLKDGRLETVSPENLVDFLLANQGNLVKERSKRLGPPRSSEIAC